MTPAVRALVYANVGVFLLTFFAERPAGNAVVHWLGLSPRLLFEQFQVWRLATYLFVHDPGGFSHILFNMLALWMFGVDLERRWGSRGFLRYYFVTGIGAGVGTVLVSVLPFELTRP